MILVTPLKLQICAEHILFFDMDDTLINTNFANFLSYQKAFFAVTHAKLNANYHPKQSFNRKALKKAAPHLNQQTYDNVIQEKERLYHEFLVETELNNPNFSDYTTDTVNHLLLIYSGYDGYYATSLCHELIYKYIHWLEQREIEIKTSIKNKIINCVNSLLNKFNLNLSVSNDISNNLITSQELKNKISLIRQELKLFDNSHFNILDIKKRITCNILNKKLEDSQLNKSQNFNPFDDELETIIMD